jgi:hypothetical protein
MHSQSGDDETCQCGGYVVYLWLLSETEVTRGGVKISSDNLHH